AKFRKSPLFADSRRHYAAGWSSHDLVADPQFASLPTDESRDADLRLQPKSPAIDAGQPLPSDWPDPLRELDQHLPDAGALPRGVDSWKVGVDARISVVAGFGSSSKQ